MTLPSKMINLKLIIVTMLACSCGKSIFKSIDKSDPAVDAATALEKKQPLRAIKLIFGELGSSYKSLYDDLDYAVDTTEGTALLENKMNDLIETGKIRNVPNLISILASAKAQLHGIDPFEIALKMAETATSQGDTTSATSGSTSNPVTALFPVLPAATTENLHGLDVAMAVLKSLGSQQTTADQYKEAIFLTASIALVMKTLDSDGNGEISALESITLSDAAATILLNQISSAASAAIAGDDGTQPASAQEIQGKIDAEDGATQEEKLRNFMANGAGQGL